MGKGFLLLRLLFAGWLLLLSMLSEGSIVVRVAFLRVRAFAGFICFVALIEVLAWSLLLVVF